jgi:hypothetical protein
MSKQIIILRGIPGCGKSTIANYLYNLSMLSGRSPVICCADDYFINKITGAYEWNGEKIGQAHEYCQNLFLTSLKNNYDLVIVANTSTKESDVLFYRNLAIQHGYRVSVMTVENYHEGEDEHNVPEETKIKMRNSLKNSQRLFNTQTELISHFLQKDKIQIFELHSEPEAIAYEHFCKKYVGTKITYSKFNSEYNLLKIKYKL